MARDKKPQQVDEVAYGGMTVPVMFERNKLYFFGKIGSKIVDDKTADGVKVKIVEAIKDYHNVEWKPLIVAKAFRYGMRYEFDRCYYGISNSGKVLLVSWSTEPERRLERAKDIHWEYNFRNSLKPGQEVIPFIPPIKSPRDSSVSEQITYVPYTEQKWAAFNRMAEAIEQIKKKIDGMLCEPEGIEELTSRFLTNNLLPAANIEE